MRKSLLLVLLFLSVLPLGLKAQNSLFDLESDTVCIGQKVNIRPHAQNAATYYWGFCSGYLNNPAILDDLGAGFQFNQASSIEVGHDGNKFYGFVVNPVGELLKLDFGNSLINIPTVTNLGDLNSSITASPNSLYLTQDGGKWYLFMCGGGGGNPSSISRIDFGTSLNNVPNGVNMGNPGGLLNDPRGIFVAQQGNVYYGFVVNNADNKLIRLNFGNNISKTPSETNVAPIATGGFGPPPGLGGPTDIAPVFDQGFWYFFVTNTGFGNSTVLRLYFGNTLSNVPVLTTAVANSTGGGGGNPPTPSKLKGASGITVLKDCGNWYGYITNKTNDSLLKYSFGSLSSGWSFNSAYVAPFNAPTDLSRIVRDRDSLYMFVVNSGSNGLTRILFPQCQNASIASSTSPIPPSPSYNDQGTYNIYLAINEGKPNAAVDCKQVTVIRIPPINLSHDTLICQGDTLHVIAGSQYALNYIFSPNYNISDTQGINIKVYPTISTTYTIRIPFPEGCVVDTTLRVDVSRVKADAGPDRSIGDGASTVIGGPNTYKGNIFTYQWFPIQYLDNPFSLTPTATPAADITYYLKVTNTDGCVSIDTVNVKVSCGGNINLPNAFAPENTHGAPRRFGILNKELVQLNYFRIFDRWGKEVFSTTDVTKQWDGTVGGNPAPFGVYVWEADGFCSTGERVSKSGNVTLIR